MGLTLASIRGWWQAALTPAPAESGPRPPNWTALHATVPRLEQLLHQNLLPFWLGRAHDPVMEGFDCHFAADGTPLGPAPRFLVSQARLTWFFARTARAGLHSDRMGALAEHGARFLADRMWDRDHGGFFWSVSPDGHTPVEPEKRAYGQAFAMYALQEAARQPGLEGSLRLVQQTHELLQGYLRDPEHGGYFRSRTRDWTAPGDPGGYWDGTTKSINDHLHLLEPYLGYAHAPPNAAVGSALAELVLILAHVAPDPATGAIREAFRKDWTLRPDHGQGRTSYGHGVEAAWLLPLATEELGAPAVLMMRPAMRMLRQALARGWDSRHGGLYESGPIRGRPDRKDKVWWAQAECLLACLWLHIRTGDPLLLEYYLGILDWIERFQVDWELGEWHHTLPPGGRPSGPKAGPWRDPYHQGRALLTSLELIASPPGP